MLLPLAWLIQVEDTPKHREMLERCKRYPQLNAILRRHCNPWAIIHGDFPSPQSNESLRHDRSRPDSEMATPPRLLYTVNYASSPA